MFNDFRYAVRTLRRKPGYTVAAVIALALGVGANTSIYSIAQGLLFRPLALVDLDRVVIVEGGRPDRFDEVGVTAADVMDIRDRATSFEHVAIELVECHRCRGRISGTNPGFSCRP